jgi:hypothetical protein
MAEYRKEDLNSWADFVEAVRNLQEQTPALRALHAGIRIPDLLFRGHHEASWTLDTTLERSKPSSLSLAHYYTSISAALPQIEAHTGQRWEIERPDIYREKTRDSDAGFYFKTQFPGYDYMCYLRHHGFPSPLLDWTRSPYVAAFFAFRNEGDSSGRVAIYVYRETAGVGKAGMVGAPGIDVRGPYVRTHRRHFLQQCEYTVCMQFHTTDLLPQWYYASHEAVFAVPNSRLLMPGQDQLWKFTLPRSERERVLTYLDEHNLNAYSLFGSEEALMEMMARRELLSRSAAITASASTVQANDIEPEVMEVIHEAIKKQRPYADHFGFAADPSTAEVGVAEEICKALAAAGQPLATDIVSRGRGNDPPDCEGVAADGAQVAIEVTELVDPDAIKAAKAGRVFDWAEWTQEKLVEEVQKRLSAKDSKTLRGGPYATYVVIIHTDEPLLNIERVRSLLGTARFRQTAQVSRAFLLLSYDAKSQTCPFIELSLGTTRPA